MVVEGMMMDGIWIGGSDAGKCEVGGVEWGEIAGSVSSRMIGRGIACTSVLVADVPFAPAAPASGPATGSRSSTGPAEVEE